MTRLGKGFGLHKSTVCKILKETLDAIWDVLNPVYLKPPTAEQWKKEAQKFNDLWQFPNAAGAIDGKHVPMHCPPNSESEFINDKRFHSIALLAVTSADYKFLLVDVVANGQESDGGMISNSLIGKQLAQHKLLPPIDGPFPLCFVGDEAFPLMTNLMCPYPAHNLNSRKRFFNYRLSRARHVIENAFGVLVTQFECLQHAINGSVEHVERVTKACICLHNFLLRDKVYFPDNLFDHYISDQVTSGNCPTSTNFFHGNMCPTTDAVAARETLTDYFVSDAGSVPFQDGCVILE